MHSSFRGLEENFRGSTTDDFNKICELFFSEMRQELPDFEMPADDQRRSASDILKGISVPRAQKGVPLQLWPRFPTIIDPTPPRGNPNGDGCLQAHSLELEEPFHSPNMLQPQSREQYEQTVVGFW